MRYVLLLVLVSFSSFCNTFTPRLVKGRARRKNYNDTNNIVAADQYNITDSDWMLYAAGLIMESALVLKESESAEFQSIKFPGYKRWEDITIVCLKSM
jgi:hypothetical protein